MSRRRSIQKEGTNSEESPSIGQTQRRYTDGGKYFNDGREHGFYGTKFGTKVSGGRPSNKHWQMSSRCTPSFLKINFLKSSKK